MTFSFVLDAMPDYTKFDGTHKVLAELQVITDDVDAAEESRATCHPVVITSVDDDLTIDIVTSGANETLTVKGKDIDGANNYNASMFPGLEGKNATELQLEFNEMKPNKFYKIKQTNPMLSNWPGDEFITGTVKEKVYNGKDLVNDVYCLVIGEDKTDVTVEVTELEKETDALGKTMRNVIIKNEITFKATDTGKTVTQSPAKKVNTFNLDND